MSSLNINDLYGTIHERNIKRPTNSFSNALKLLLKTNGFELLYIEPNWLFISWEVKQPTINDSLKKQKSDGKKLKSQEFKTIDDYKPNGNFVYNLNDIQVMKNKTINLL